jgi:TolB protein
VLRRAATALEALWADCSVAAQATLAVSNELPGRHGTFTRNDIISATKRHSANLREDVADAALSELEMLGMLEKLGRGSYRHTLELFRLWCAENRRLESLLDRGKEYKRVLGAGGSLLSTFTWRAALGWGGLLAALVFFALLWNSRQPATTVAARQTPTAGAPVATRPPVLPGTSQGWITYMAKPNPDAAWDVWLMRGDGSDPKRLTNDAANNQTPCWSADGRLIAFVSDRDGNKEIYTVKADGTTPLNLTHNPAEDWTPGWSRDGTTIAFSSYRDGNWEIYLMDANGANPRRLTRNTAADYAPSWSPDGQRIAFQSNRDGNWEIYVMSKDGKGAQRLTDDEGTDSAPAWSPDGELIAFESYRDGNMEIYVVAADGSEVRNLTQDEYSNEHGPAWARAGTRLLYYSNRDGGWDIYSMKADGTEKENLTLNPVLEQRPNWHE